MILSASIKLLSETQFYLSIWTLNVHWQGWSEMGHISAEYVIQLIYYYYISGKLDHIYLEKQQDNSEKDNGSKHMEGVMQGEGMLDKIGIAYWISLPNTPILWTTSVTNCRILSQELCFRGSQYHKCSLLVSGWRYTVSLTSHMDFARLFETLWSPWM